MGNAEGVALAEAEGVGVDVLDAVEVIVGEGEDVPSRYGSGLGVAEESVNLPIETCDRVGGFAESGGAV
ncbi:MAG: hypothetical protein GTO18_04730 [Anaerolineales bacterium]|nr:hypothetical protein [Anaerolineales bacterium]